MRAARSIGLVAVGAMFLLNACGGSAAPVPSGGAATPAAPSGPATPATSPMTSATPSDAPGVDLTTLEGNWVAAMNDVRLNYATGDFVGGVITIDGARIRLEGGGKGTGAAGVVGPVEVSLCGATSCQVRIGQFPSLIVVLGDGSLAVVDITNPTKPLNAGAGTCGSPVVDAAGIITLSPDGQQMHFVAGTAGAIGEGAGDACAGSVYQITWTQVLTRAP